LCQMNLYHDSHFPLTINFLLHWSWAFKL
jgi:hypothetical protein